MWQKTGAWLSHRRTNFYSHIPCGMWRLFYLHFCIVVNFYSHIPCGMWPITVSYSHTICIISTHTSRVGCDNTLLFNVSICLSISTHTSRVGCDPAWERSSSQCCISTHTSRVGCDQSDLFRQMSCSHFYSHIPCGMWPISKQAKRRRR